MNHKGQYGVVRTHTPIGWLIRLATRSQVSHAYIYITEDLIVEATWAGAVITHASKFEKATSLHPVSRFPLTPAEQDAVTTAARALVGTPYGFLDILALGLVSLGVQWKWARRVTAREKGLICSQLVDRAYRNAGIHLYTDGRPDGSVTPGDLLLLLAERSLLTTYRSNP